MSRNFFSLKTGHHASDVFFKNQAIWHDSDMLKSFLIGAFVGALFAFGCAFLSPSHAGELTHTWKSPAFSGQGYSAHVLTIENQEFSRSQAIKEKKEEDKKEEPKQTKAQQKQDQKQKAGSKIVKNMGDKGRYDSNNQLKTLLVMQVLGNSKTFFNDQKLIQDTPGFFSDLIVPDTQISDNNFASFIMFGGSNVKMDALVDSQYNQ